jgi:kinesin family protein 15
VQESAAIAERNVEIMHRDMEKMTRKHATEVATMNQRLLEARLLKSRVCPMCQVAGRVKYEFPDADEAILEAEAAAKEEQTMSKPERRGHFEPFPDEYDDVDYLRMGEPSWFTGYDSCNI